MEGWKRCTALLAAALLSLSLAACGKDGGGDITPTKLEGMVKEAYDGTVILPIWASGTVCSTTESRSRS